MQWSNLHPLDSTGIQHEKIRDTAPPSSAGEWRLDSPFHKSWNPFHGSLLSNPKSFISNPIPCQILPSTQSIPFIWACLSGFHVCYHAVSSVQCWKSNTVTCCVHVQVILTTSVFHKWAAEGGVLLVASLFIATVQPSRTRWKFWLAVTDVTRLTLG